MSSQSAARSESLQGRSLARCLPVLVGKLTHRGGRENNEDECCAAGTADLAQTRAGLQAVAVVCDGMGGHAAGEVASGIVTDRLEAAFVRDAYPPGVVGPMSVAEAIRSVVASANSAVYRLAQDDASKSGMGTTCTVAVLHDDMCYVGHVGDSRAYLVRGGQARQLTEDHTVVAAAVRDGDLTPDEAQRSKYRNQVTRAVGTQPEVQIDTVEEWECHPGDFVVLGSDGLCEYVSEADIAEVCVKTADPQAAAAELVGKALARDTHDNATAVVIEVRTLTGRRPRLGATRRPSSVRSLLCLAGAVAVLLAVCAVGLAVRYGWLARRGVVTGAAHSVVPEAEADVVERQVGHLRGVKPMAWLRHRSEPVTVTVSEIAPNGDGHGWLLLTARGGAVVHVTKDLGGRGTSAPVCEGGGLRVPIPAPTGPSEHRRTTDTALRLRPCRDDLPTPAPMRAGGGQRLMLLAGTDYDVVWAGMPEPLCTIRVKLTAGAENSAPASGGDVGPSQQSLRTNLADERRPDPVGGAWRRPWSRASDETPRVQESRSTEARHGW